MGNPFSTDPVACGGGRRAERTTGAEALRAGAPAAPYIRPPSREKKQRRRRRPRRWWRRLRPARRIPHPTPTSPNRGRAGFVTQAGRGAHTGRARHPGAPRPRSPSRSPQRRPRIQASPGPAEPRRRPPFALRRAAPRPPPLPAQPCAALASPNLKRREKSQKPPSWRRLRRCLLCDRN